MKAIKREYWIAIMATIIVCRSNAKVRHWYMSGEGFFGAHSYFDQVVDTIEDFEDYFAERKSLMGLIRPSSLTECLEESLVKDARITSSDINLLLVKEIEDLQKLIGLVYGGFAEDGVFDPSEQSGVTNWTDELKNRMYWLAKYIKVSVEEIPIIKLNSNE